MRIKNYSQFQHFKDRRPPWIKLYRDILEDPDIMMISDWSFKVLVCLWLIASEDKEQQGNLPPVENIAFRLRCSKDKVDKALGELVSFVEQDDIKPISECHQNDIPETETEKRREEKEKRQRRESAFQKWYDSYQKKVGREPAWKVWKRLSYEDCKACLEVVDAYVKSKPDPRYRPNPATYLNQRRWEDEIIAPEPQYKSKTRYVSDEEGVYKCEKCGRERVQTLQAHQPRPRCCGENMLRRFDV